MPPVLDPTKSKVDGLAFVGLSLARKSDVGHPASSTHQTSFDLNRVLDRDYKYIFSSNDDGWLVGGGEPGPPHSYKLAAPDSAHVEIMRIGTYNASWGGIASAKEIIQAVKEGKILIPEMTVVPTAVVANSDSPPELEIRFDMAPAYHDPEPDSEYEALPVNWQLRFVQNQLYRHFNFPSRFTPGAFHSTILRKAEFRSPAAESSYFARCDKAVRRWRRQGPQPLVPTSGTNVVDPTSKTPSCNSIESFMEVMDDMLTPQPDASTSITSCLDIVDEMLTPVPDAAASRQSGVWLFTDRQHPTHCIAPNFFAPYDTPEKRALIHQVLSEVWNPDTLSWQEAPALPSPELLLVPERRGDCTTPKNGAFDPILGFSSGQTEEEEDVREGAAKPTSLVEKLRSLRSRKKKSEKKKESVVIKKKKKVTFGWPSSKRGSKTSPEMVSATEEPETVVAVSQ